MLEDRVCAERLVVDRQLVERAGAEQGASVARHQVQRRVGERALAAGATLLLVADGLPVDVGGDLVEAAALVSITIA